MRILPVIATAAAAGSLALAGCGGSGGPNMSQINQHCHAWVTNKQPTDPQDSFTLCVEENRLAQTGPKGVSAQSLINNLRARGTVHLTLINGTEKYGVGSGVPGEYSLVFTTKPWLTGTWFKSSDVDSVTVDVEPSVALGAADANLQKSQQEPDPLTDEKTSSVIQIGNVVVVGSYEDYPHSPGSVVQAEVKRLM